MICPVEYNKPVKYEGAIKIANTEAKAELLKNLKR